MADNITIEEQNQDINLVNENPYIGVQNTAVSTDVTPVTDPNSNAVSNLIGNFDTNKFLMGLAIGAAGAYLLTNENAQKSLFKTFAKGSELFTAGIEEIKERFEDAKAEMEAKV